MKNKKVLIGVAAFVIILIIGGFLLLKKPAYNDNLSIVDGSGENSSSQMSLSEIIAKNVPQKCTVSYTDGGTKIATEIWIKGNKFKQVSIVEIPEIGKKETVMISDGAYSYIWDEETKKGSKIKLEESGEVGMENTQENINIDWNTKYEYKCTPAVIDDADLALPSGVVFTDMEAELEKIQNQMENFNIDDYMQNIPSEAGE